MELEDTVRARGAHRQGGSMLGLNIEEEGGVEGRIVEVVIHGADQTAWEPGVRA